MQEVVYTMQPTICIPQHITQSAAEAQMQKRVQVKPLSMTDADHQQQIWP